MSSGSGGYPARPVVSKATLNPLSEKELKAPVRPVPGPAWLFVRGWQVLAPSLAGAQGAAAALGAGLDAGATSRERGCCARGERVSDRPGRITAVALAAWTLFACPTLSPLGGHGLQTPWVGEKERDAGPGRS